MKFKIIMVTCDKTQWILPIAFYFFNKYLPKECHVTVLGFNKPSIEFPDNISFYSMGFQQNIQQWSWDIYNFTKTINQEYLLFLLDDFFLFNHLRMDKLSEIITMMDQDKTIGLCNIAMAPQFVDSTDKILVNEEDYFLFEQHSNMYQINCQPALYRTSHFNKYFNKKNDPWKLELNPAHRNIPERLICCSPLNKQGNRLHASKNQQPIYKSQLKSALSGKMFPGKLNMNGVKPEDLEYLIKQKLVDKNMVIYKK